MNAFKQLLQNPARGIDAHPRASHQRVPLGTWVMSASPLVAEAIGHAGFDWAVLDMEHSPLELPGVVQMLQALATTKLVPIVRLPANDAVLFKRLLDAGASTLMVPFVQSAAEARRAVAATRYPPLGMRGVAGMSRATRYGTLRLDTQAADAGVALILQLETPQALDALEEIAAVEGVDALFIGPADLSAALGHGGNARHPAVQKLAAQAAERARAAGIPIGTLAGTPEMATQVRAAGFDFVGLGSDLGLLVHAAQASLHALRTPDAAAVHSLHVGTHAY
ncbi:MULTISPECIES: aldolase/citrate lyase family protein [Methylibium]|uniref:2-dehydro-3-deoxyglucarate aldolase n=1 Tax=Methylibium petroleiphilum (strain ATCC BAA-1232 / LMG 22953 / PM1) TaxID=420662 RepID=A2SC62_METPP|nr:MULTISPECIES: aldolase/citrate lyase family protein [Methylibium]ABM93151.1 2-dehydro-3-deoxyglucarate aldolase [Methylibium petroleiphilum PM1]EWS54238.1 5-keto-4-deoxy-D-glucarate aldolase [Methylibium sp. T29]EWS60233.1 5-keto-4-deoxy-D-glucarate aldolase [Methylibium sp. T29-B]